MLVVLLAQDYLATGEHEIRKVAVNTDHVVKVAAHQDRRGTFTHVWMTVGAILEVAKPFEEVLQSLTKIPPRTPPKEPEKPKPPAFNFGSFPT
jgi:hypothetical protein